MFFCFSIDEILADLDESDMEVDEMVDDRPKAKGKKKNNDVWIREEADDIVDFTDVSTAKKISGESRKFYAVLKFFHENLFWKMDAMDAPYL